MPKKSTFPMKVVGCMNILLALTLAAHAQEAIEFPSEEKLSRQEGTGSEIIVTARRVEQRLMDVPLSVTAITEEEISTRQIIQPTDISRLTPNVNLTGETAGSSTLRAYIRGGGITDGGNLVSESEVAMYINDVYNARMQGALVDFAEIERIEVLRGPQGVLYGRNSSAGAINIITKRPSRDLTGSVQAGIGNWDERRLKGHISIPLDENGDWALGINGLMRKRDGGRQYAQTIDRDVGEIDTKGGMVDLVYQRGNLSARANIFYMDTDGDGQFAVNTMVRDGEIVPISGSYRTVLSPVRAITDTRQYGGTLHLSMEHATGMLKSITGYSKLKDRWMTDFSGGVPGYMIGQDPNTLYALYERDSTADPWQFSEEIQALGDLFEGKLNYVTGLYYFHEEGKQIQDSIIFFAPSRIVFIPETDAYAVYADFTWKLSDDMELEIGGRYTKENKTLDGAVSGVTVAGDDSFSRFTPQVGLSYDWNDHVMLYVNYREGFKAGGYNGLASTAEQLETAYRPQITKAYEGGIKGSLTSSLSGSLIGFFNKIENRQQTVNLLDGGFLIENYDVDIKGIELELVWRPFSWLQFWGNGALNWGKYKDTDSAIASLVGNDPPSLPDYEYTIGADLSYQRGEGEWRFGADFNQRDSYFSTADNVAIGHVKEMHFVNAYVAYTYGPWELQLAGKNLLQETGWFSGFGFSVVNPRFMIEPRTILTTARYRF